MSSVTPPMPASPKADVAVWATSFLALPDLQPVPCCRESGVAVPWLAVFLGVETMSLIARVLIALALICGLPQGAHAAVEIAFYSRELGGNNFPHAFVALHGIVDSTGEQVDTSYGFTARAVTPA